MSKCKELLGIPYFGIIRQSGVLCFSHAMSPLYEHKIYNSANDSFVAAYITKETSKLHYLTLRQKKKDELAYYKYFLFFQPSAALLTENFLYCQLPKCRFQT